MRIYIAGPMTGLPDLNRKAFADACYDLGAKGIEAVNPHILHPPVVEWPQAMRTDLVCMLNCDAVALLDGWRQSRGALLEHYVATSVGIHCAPLETYL